MTIQRPAPDVAKKLKTSLESATTATTQSLRLLRALLGFDVADTGLKAPPKRQYAAKTVNQPGRTKATNKSSAKITKQSAGDFEIHEENIAPTTALPATRRQRYATEIFNTSLKTLSNAAKSRQVPAKGELSSRDSPIKVPKSSNAKSSTPLQQCSGNEAARAKGISKSHSTQSDGIEVVAACAEASLDCLRSLSSNNQEAEHLQREQGGLSLLDKLINLRLEKQARTQASKIYEQYWKRRKDSSSGPGDAARTKISAKFQLADLMLLPPITGDGAELHFATSFQSQLLRLAILLGPTVVTNDFVEGFGVRHHGSPPQLILHGRKEGFLEDGAAGLQLRTISLALLKLYSTAIIDSRGENNQPATTFQLLTQALQVKCKSWFHLGHKPDLERELWLPFLQGVKRLSKSSGKSTTFFSILVDACEKITETLKDAGFNETFSANVTTLMLDLAERHDDLDAFMHWAHMRQKSLDCQNEFETVLLLWRQAILMYRCCKIITAEMTLCFSRVLGSLSTVSVRHDDVEDLLTHGSNLRRICVAIARSDNATIQKPRKDSNPGIQEVCIQILIRLPQVFSKHLQITSDTLDLHADHDATIFKKVISIAKVVDTILNLRSLVNYQKDTVQLEYKEALDFCQSFSPGLLKLAKADTMDDPTVSFLESFRARLSSDSWVQYLEAMTNGESGLHCLPHVERSVDALRSSPPNAQQSASFGPKLEKLATIYLQLKRPNDARQAFEEAIRYYISIGAAADATDAALSKSSRLIWSKSSTSRVYCLGKALMSHAKLALTYDLHSAGSEAWLLDSPSLSAISRCVLWEKQLQAASDVALNVRQHEALQACVKECLNMCAEENFATFRARFVQNLLGLNGKTSEHLRDCLDPEVVRLTADNCIEQKSVYLKNFTNATRYCLRIQCRFYAGVIDIVEVMADVTALGQIVLNASSLADLELRVDDVELCCKQLQMLQSYARMLDHTDLSTEVLAVLKYIFSLQDNPRRHVQVSTQVAILQTRLGQYDTAKASLMAAEAGLENQGPSLTGVTWMLASVYHSIKTEDTPKAREMLAEASRSYEQTCQGSELNTNRDRLEKDALLARAALLSSQISFASGSLAKANQHARQAVKIATAIWQLIERSEFSQTDNSGSVNDPVQSLTADFSNLAIVSHSKVQWQTKGAAFWDYVDLQYDALQHLVTLSFHNGLHQDTLLYGDQMRKIAASVGSVSWIQRSTLTLAFLHAKADQHEKAIELLSHVPVKDISLDVQTLHFNLLYCEVLIEVNSKKAAATILCELAKHVEQLLEPVNPPLVSAPAAARRGKTKATRVVKTNPKHPAQRHPPALPKSPASFKLPAGHNAIWDRISRLKTLLAMDQVSDSVTSRSNVTTTTSAASNVTAALLSLQTALDELSSDAVKCILAETAVALPVKYQSNGKNGRVSFFHKPATKNGRSVKASATATGGEQILLNAYNSLQNPSNIDLDTCSSEIVHLASKVHSKLALLTSTMDSAQISPSLQLVQRSLMASNIARARERMVIQAETVTSSKEQVQQWPSSCDEAVTAQGLPGLPASWHVISLSLSEDRKELLMARMVGDQSPFVVRIPLSRSDLEADEDFAFENAMEELRDIIEKTNASCHDRRGQGTREARLEWYVERQALDERLGNLLGNIETIWLGGFVGLMKACHIEEEVLSQFGQSLTRILDRHLPSRRKPISKVDLHNHVSQLFLSLADDHKDIDDAVSDLLYFVVDILQFSGERNAYDEIDFDAMLVDTLDAIRQSAPRRSTDHHIILIIDKDLAAIPWESLPCMQNQSVSRMPSLDAIAERLTVIRSQNPISSGYSLPTTRAAYMLNPGSDLPSTQLTLSPILTTHLRNFTSTTDTPPTEPDFIHTLTTNDLFLYFGHGSGAQYIRGRRIRSLPRCAVTLLMGCSSAKMTTAGKLESYGVPGYYIGGTSNCMAVLGTLWDVTDRDIDRFSVRLMVEWGLIPGDDEAVNKAMKKSNSARTDRLTRTEEINKKKQNEIRGHVSLSEAVSRARDACALKHLNGAASVVYGVPVFLAAE